MKDKRIYKAKVRLDPRKGMYHQKKDLLIKAENISQVERAIRKKYLDPKIKRISIVKVEVYSTYDDILIYNETTGG